MVDPAIIPPRPIFDYSVTFRAPAALTADGALDGISHALEVLYSAVGKPEYLKVERVAAEAIRLVVKALPRVLANPADEDSRHALGLATDLGGYAIMLGGTNGAHLTSFSLVDILSHGRACGLMNPYYTVFFAPAIQTPLRLVGRIYQEAGYTQENIDALSGRALGEAVARAMICFEEKVGFPSTLGQVPGFTDAHITRALKAAKDPQLKMKLENMPVPLTAETVERYMGPILRAAKRGSVVDQDDISWLVETSATKTPETLARLPGPWDCYFYRKAAPCPHRQPQSHGTNQSLSDRGRKSAWAQTSSSVSGSRPCSLWRPDPFGSFATGRQIANLLPSAQFHAIQPAATSPGWTPPPNAAA